MRVRFGPGEPTVTRIGDWASTGLTDSGYLTNKMATQHLTEQHARRALFSMWGNKAVGVFGAGASSEVIDPSALNAAAFDFALHNPVTAETGFQARVGPNRNWIKIPQSTSGRRRCRTKWPMDAATV
jgi:hypothetical protein